MRILLLILFLPHILRAQTDVQRYELKGPVRYYHYTEERTGKPDQKGDVFHDLDKRYHYFSPQGMTLADSHRHVYRYREADEYKQNFYASFSEKHPGGRVVKRLEVTGNMIQDESTYYKYDMHGRLLQVKWFYMFGDHDTVRMNVTNLSYYPDGRLKKSTDLRGPSDRKLVYQFETRYRYEKNKEISTTYNYWGFKFNEAERTETIFDAYGRKAEERVYNGKKMKQVHQYVYYDAGTDPPAIDIPGSDHTVSYLLHTYWHKDRYGNYLKCLKDGPRYTEYRHAQIEYYQ